MVALLRVNKGCATKHNFSTYTLYKNVENYQKPLGSTGAKKLNIYIKKLLARLYEPPRAF